MTIVRTPDAAKLVHVYRWISKLGRETSRRYAMAMVEHLCHGIPEPKSIPCGRQIRATLEQVKLFEPVAAPIGPVVNRLRLDALANLRTAALALQAIEAREPDAFRKMVAADRVGDLDILISRIEDDAARDLKTDGGN